jgi:hypothetical protein
MTFSFQIIPHFACKVEIILKILLIGEQEENFENKKNAKDYFLQVTMELF